MEQIMRRTRRSTPPLLRALAAMWLLLAALLLMPAAASAQRLYKPHVHVGVKGGATFSTVSFFPSIKDKMLGGTQFGVSFRYAEERHVGLMAELNLTQRGWAENLTGTSLRYSHRTTYVELPLLTHIFFGNRTIKGFFNLGPQLGYMIYDNVDANFNYRDPMSVPGFPHDNRHLEQMKLSITNRFDYGITAGAGCELTLFGRNSFTLEARYYYGLANLFPSAKKDYFSASRGSSIMATLGYMFRVK